MMRAYGPLIVKLGLAVTAICLFLLVPTSLLDSGPSICIFKNIFGFNCPGCGMLRAISSVFHGQFRMAYQYNKLIIVVFPLLGLIFLKTMSRDFQKVIKNRNSSPSSRVKS